MRRVSTAKAQQRLQAPSAEQPSLTSHPDGQTTNAGGAGHAAPFTHSTSQAHASGQVTPPRQALPAEHRT